MSHEAEAFRHKLQPKAIRSNLVRAGLFLAAWELLKGEIIGQVRGFFLMTLGDEKPDPRLLTEYKKTVLSRHDRSVFLASLSWLVEAKALTEEQAKLARALKEYRDEVAHELPKLLLEPGCDIDVARIREAQSLIVVLGRFWGRITAETDPQFDGQEIEDTAIQSGIMMLMDVLVAALDSTE
jgi:hypothetical protein